MGNKLKVAKFVSDVFIVHAIAGAGFAAGAVGTFIAAAKLMKPQLKKAWDSIPPAGSEETK